MTRTSRCCDRNCSRRNAFSWKYVSCSLNLDVRDASKQVNVFEMARLTEQIYLPTLPHACTSKCFVFATTWQTNRRTSTQDADRLTFLAYCGAVGVKIPQSRSLAPANTCGGFTESMYCKSVTGTVLVIGVYQRVFVSVGKFFTGPLVKIRTEICFMFCLMKVFSDWWLSSIPSRAVRYYQMCCWSVRHRGPLLPYEWRSFVVRGDSTATS